MDNLEYIKAGDYYIPALKLTEEPAQPLSRYGNMRKTFLKEHRKGYYHSLLLREMLYQHLYKVQRTAEERLERMMRELIEKFPPPNRQHDPMGWTAHMNSLQAQAEEIILTELIYA